MKRFRNILLVSAADGRDLAAVDRAASLARRNRARLTVCTVIDEIPAAAGMLITAIPTQEILAQAVDVQRERLEALAAPLREGGIGVAVKVAVGRPSMEIVRQVLRDGHDLVVMAAEGDLVGRLFGSTSLHVMRKCPCPVWVVKRTQTKPFMRILVAVNPDFSDPHRLDLCRLILDLASALARMENSELHVAHAWRLYGEDYIRIRGGLSAEQIREVKEAEKAQHKEGLDRLLGGSDVADLHPHVHLVEGSADRVVLDLVRDQGIDLLVMGSLGRTGIAGLFIGNTAEEVLNQVDCSVLTVKPEGFASPVSVDQ
jgi:nucleotide-binding universal stress UspA family protein